MGSGWIGVDLDGTLAEYNGDVSKVGAPLIPMLNRVREYLKRGIPIKIVTARVGSHQDEHFDQEQRLLIATWLQEECKLPVLEITNQKDFGMIYLYDDRSIRVESNKGEPCTVCKTMEPF